MNKMIKECVSPLVYNDTVAIVERQLPWEKLDGKAVLITGANGFISYYLALTCLIRNDLYHSNIQVLGLVRSEKNAEKKYGQVLQREDFRLIVQDVCEDMEVEHVDLIIHAASQASAWHFENDPVGTINANLLGTQNVLELARKHRAEVLFVSSLKIYGSFKESSKAVILEEDRGDIDHISYKNCYAIGKLAAETLCASYHKQYGVRVKIVRPSYIYGATTMKDDRVWAQFIVNVINDEDIVLKSNGAPYRSFCYVTDTVAAIFTVILKGEVMQPYNISSEKSNVTIRGFAKNVVEAFPEKHLKLSFANKEDEKEPDIQASISEILESSKLEELGWNAKVGIKDGIRRAAEIMMQS